METKYRMLIFLDRNVVPGYIEMRSDEDIKKHTAQELNSDFDWYYYTYNGESITVKVRPSEVQAVIKNVRVD